ncbi:MAG: phytoene/squalene synthase family protein [Bacteroidetes bacterium]|nr:phytoene/squalene synthase family protein [Bacteroidota bacterium]
MMHLFQRVSEGCSKITTETYSTSFASAIRLLHKDLRTPIYNIYGFVRFADEIVDTFHGFDRQKLLTQFKNDAFLAIDNKISLNPILHSFQATVNYYNMDRSLIESFFKSMQMDLDKKQYDQDAYDEYIYGSAEVVGLMCLYVFCEGDKHKFLSLKPYACSLGAAFQKVNFLRDIRSDYNDLHRVYFPGVDFNNFTSCIKSNIEEDITRDFNHAYEGILQLPVKARFSVYVAYKYYLSLFDKIKSVQPSRIMSMRIRIPNYRKLMIIMRAGLKNQLKQI